MEQISIYTPNRDTKIEIKNKISQIVSRALDRFAGVIRAIEIRLTDSNGPKGGVDKICTLKVVHAHSKGLVIKGKGVSFIHATHVASAVARNTLARAQDKSRAHRASVDL